MSTSSSTSQPAHSSGSTRKLGQGYSLALNTGSNTHLTLVYFNNCKRGYEQDLAKSMANDYFQSKSLTTVDFEIRERFNERSVRVKGPVLDTIIEDLKKLYSAFDIDSNQIAHIDLRGNPVSAIQSKGVSLVNNFIY